MFDAKETDLFDLEEEVFDTIIEQGITFSGNITFAKPFMIRGKIKGKIDTTSDLVIEEGAEVEADIKVDRILVKGKVKGNINAKKIVFISSSGSVDGDITSAQVVLEQGSIFTGKCTMEK
ncbi:MAG: polymer-forming cytoskeletal protein [Treponema sp.]|nr:polymer-forming cytoskeletal protein [Treponema sp.]